LEGKVKIKKLLGGTGETNGVHGETPKVHPNAVVIGL